LFGSKHLRQTSHLILECRFKDKERLLTVCDDVILLQIFFIRESNYLHPLRSHLRKMMYTIYAGTSPINPEATGPSEANKSSGKCNMNPNQCPSKQVKPVACINKILKFKLFVDTNVPDASAQP